MYINTLPLRSRINEGQRIVEWILGLQRDQVFSRQYQYTPLQQIQGWSGIPGDLFDSIVVFENYPVSAVVAAKQWSLQVEKVQINRGNKFPVKHFYSQRRRDQCAL
jgi:hypothetical protein